MNNYNNLNTSTSTGVYVYTVLTSQNICFKRVMESQVVSYVIECASLINNRERSEIILVPLRLPFVCLCKGTINSVNCSLTH